MFQCVVGWLNLGGNIGFVEGRVFLLRASSKFGTIVLTVHLNAKGLLVSLEEFVMVRALLGSLCDAFEIPTIEFSDKTRILGSTEIFLQYTVGELFTIRNDKRFSLGQP
mmetsp:Transcript_27597/g.40754  ORF Transcript_27597/g.40754 Transcript_27597/m.40754 type:complete len:109 (-) Transcript_27597:151-477(-)